MGRKLNTPYDFGTVKLSKQNVVIPQGKTIPVTCRVRADPVPERIPVVFEPTIDTDVPDDLVVSESLTYLQKGSSCSITVLVQNPTNHDVVNLKDGQYSKVLKPLAPWLQFHVPGQLLKILIIQKR